MNRYKKKSIIVLSLFLLSFFRVISYAQSLSGLPYDVLLGRQTDQSIALSVLAYSPTDIIVDYGTQSGVYTSSTAVNSVAANATSLITLSGLNTDSNYFYRIRYRATGGSAYTSDKEYSFYTQRAPGKTFSFDIEADPHYQDNEPVVWAQTMANIAADKPDFLIDIGDTFMDEKFGASTLAQVMASHLAVRSQNLALIGASVPLYLVSGNHDPELGWLLSNSTPSSNVAVWGVQARQFYYPCPVANNFYSMATTPDPYTGGPRDAYYAFTWGDALFIALDPFWYTCQGVAHNKDPWTWTLGKQQYDWLTNVLKSSNAKFKFVFMHHIIGGSMDGAARGGVELSSFYEWGGSNIDGTYGFTQQRPGWAMPIQDLLLKYGVTAVFHGHDHLYVKQILDSNGNGIPRLIYQELPQPSRSNQAITSGILYGYHTGVLYPSSGHMRVTISPTSAKFDYVRGVTSTDTNALKSGVVNNQVQYSYTLNAPTNVSLPLIYTEPIRQSVSVGSTVSFNVGVTSGTSCTYQWSKDSVPISGATSSSYSFKALDTSYAGNYSVSVTNQAGTVSSSNAYLSVAGNQGRLINLSVLSMDGPSSQLLTLGFVSGGSGTVGSQNLLIRGSGPALTDFGVKTVMADPTLTLFSGTTALQTNDNWGTPASNLSAVAAANTQTGAFPYTSTTSLDAALVASLSSIKGGYTVQVAGKGAATGNVLAEVYDISGSSTYVAGSPRLINVSCLQQIPANGILTAGFVIGGSTAVDVLVRVAGPSLSAFNVTNAIADPELNVYDSKSNELGYCIAWAGNPTVQSAISQVGAFNFTNSSTADTAVVLNLQPGSYTVQATSISGATGEALIEVYEVASPPTN
jgi:hypothetical protein